MALSNEPGVGSIQGSRELDVCQFVSDRAKQVLDLLAAVDNAELPKGEVTHGTRTVLQRQPRHMRRRAMSHNVKRLPLAQRRFAPTKGERPPPKKPPSRYYKRRQRHLLQAYARRQRVHTWLETHIWHAKRFRMENKWGYRLAMRSAQRHYRAALRDVNRHCVVQDVSFECCQELSANNRDILLSGLKRLCSADVGLTFASATAASGAQLQSLVLYSADMYPFQCIGPIQYHWLRPFGENSVDRLIIWSHPSIWQAVRDQICAVFGLERQNGGTELKQLDSVANLNELCSIKADNSAETWASAFNKVVLSVRRDRFTKLRLTGPLSTPILQRVLEPLFDPDDSTSWNRPNEELSWHRRHYTQSNTKDTYKQITAQHNLWRYVAENASDSALPLGSILPLIVGDPRFAKSERKSTPALPTNLRPIDWDLFSSVYGSESGVHSALWDEETRNEVLRMKIKDHILHDMRGNYQLHSDPKLCPNRQPLPIVLYRNSNGWDLVAPCGWSTAFWVPLQYATARAVGVVEMEQIGLHGGRINFPVDWVDSAAGKSAMSDEASNSRAAWNRKPNNRRVDFIGTMGIQFPFEYPWSSLCSLECAPGVGEFHVIRDRAVIERIKQFLQNTESAVAAEVDAATKRWSHALVCVWLKCVDRGTPAAHAIICQPTAADCTDLPVFSAPKPVQAAVCDNQNAERRPELPDFIQLENEIEVDMDDFFPDIDALKAARHKAKRKKRRLKWKCNKKLRNKKSVAAPEQSDPAAVEENKCHSSADEKMDCDSTEPDLSGTDGCRKIIGFIIRGLHCIHLSRGTAIGYVSLNALVSWRRANILLNKKPFVLYRNSTSKLYRRATVDLMDAFV